MFNKKSCYIHLYNVTNSIKVPQSGGDGCLFVLENLQDTFQIVVLHIKIIQRSMVTLKSIYK